MCDSFCAVAFLLHHEQRSASAMYVHPSQDLHDLGYDVCWNAHLVLILNLFSSSRRYRRPYQALMVSWQEHITSFQRLMQTPRRRLKAPNSREPQRKSGARLLSSEKDVPF